MERHPQTDPTTQKVPLEEAAGHSPPVQQRQTTLPEFDPRMQNLSQLLEKHIFGLETSCEIHGGGVYGNCWQYCATSHAPDACCVLTDSLCDGAFSFQIKKEQTKRTKKKRNEWR